MFSNLRNCRELYLNQNQISKIEPGSFSGLSNLEKLHLQDNLLTTLNSDMFEGFADLKQLYLFNNRLTFINEKTFIHINSVHELYLHNNHLTTLREDTFSHLRRPLELSLNDNIHNSTLYNQLQCDADLCWLKQEELQGNFTWRKAPQTFLYKPRCENGIDWDSWICNKTGNVTSVS